MPQENSMFSYLSKQTHKSTIAFILVVALLVPNFALLVPQKASAAVPTFETNLAIITPTAATAVSTAATAVSTAATAVDTNVLAQKEMPFGWDWFGYIALKIVITTMLNSIVIWAESGFEGGPSFVQDPEAFLRGVGDQAAGAFIEEKAPFLCSPFRISILGYLSRSQSSSLSEIGCTLTDVVGNIDDFVNGNFSAGGMSGWFSMTQNISNNPYDALATAKIGIHIQVSGEQHQEEKIIEIGRGFFSSRKCEVYSGHTEYDANGNPSSVQDKECAKWGPIKTPGSVVETQINNALPSGMRQLEIADEFNEAVGAVVSALLQKVLTAGLAAVQ